MTRTKKRSNDDPEVFAPEAIGGHCTPEQWAYIAAAMKEMMSTPGWKIFETRLYAYAEEKLREWLDSDTLEKAQVRMYRKTVQDVIGLAHEITKAADEQRKLDVLPGETLSTDDWLGVSSTPVIE